MRSRRSGTLLAIALAQIAGAAACGPGAGAGDRPESVAAAWPPFPADEAAARRLVDASTSAVPARVAALEAQPLARQIRESVQDGTAIAGEDAIGAWIRDRFSVPRDAYLLFGVSHDSGLQIEWVRRLVGPVHQSAPIAIATELFRADGHWSGVPSRDQTGDDRRITRYLVTGDRGAFSTLLELQSEQDYTAWKYGHLPAVLDLAQQARASGGSLLGCDAPAGLATRLQALDETTRLRIRELHCALALRDAALPAPRRVALIWGRDHLAAEGLRRFLPASADAPAIHVLGGRASAAGIEPALAARVRVAHPLLVPIGERERVLLLAAPPLGLALDQRRDDLDAPLEVAAREHVSVLAGQAGRLTTAGRSLAVTADQVATFPLRSGSHAVLWESGSSSVVFAVDMPPGGAVEVDVGPDAISVLTRR